MTGEASDKTRTGRNLRWIEGYCVVPSGPLKGGKVRLSMAQIETMRPIYEDTDRLQSMSVDGELAGYLALLHICGPEAPGNGPTPGLDIDPVDRLECRRAEAEGSAEARA